MKNKKLLITTMTVLIIAVLGLLVYLLIIGINNTATIMLLGYSTLFNSETEDAYVKDVYEYTKIESVTDNKDNIDADEVTDTGFVHFANFENLGKQSGDGFVVITSQFGWRYLRGIKDFHRGIDIRTAYGSDDGSGIKGRYIMYTVADNAKMVDVETYETEKWGRGTTVCYEFERNGVRYKIRYCHLDRFLIDGLKVGDVIPNKGTPIAVSGNTGSDTTGAHIHVDLQVYVPGSGWQWMNPMKLYGFEDTREWYANNKVRLKHTEQCSDEMIEYNKNPALRTDIRDNAAGKNDIISVFKCDSCYGGG